MIDHIKFDVVFHYKKVIVNLINNQRNIFDKIYIFLYGVKHFLEFKQSLLYNLTFDKTNKNLVLNL